MKKFAKIMTALVLIMAIMVPVFASAETTCHTMYVNTSAHQRLNLRNSCSYATLDGVITSIPYGKAINVYEFVKNGAWAIVEYNGRVGYVVSSCLSRVNPVKK